jgi:hypothetical protein
MGRKGSPRGPVREQWDVDNTASYDVEWDGDFEPAIPEITQDGGVERNRRRRTIERRHTQRDKWRESPAFAGRPSRQADYESAVQSHTRDWRTAPRQYGRRLETVGSAHAGDHRDNYHHQQPEQVVRAPRQTPWRSFQRATPHERAPILKRDGVKSWPNGARTNWPTREDWSRSARQARIQVPWRLNTGHHSYSFAGDPEFEGDVPEWAHNEASQSPIESHAPQTPRPRWRESNDMRLHQRHWPENSREERPSTVLRHRWASTPRSEWQSTRSSVLEQDTVVLRPVVGGESRFRNDSNLSVVERQRRERRRSSVKQDSGSRQAAMGLPAWAVAPATSGGPACDDDTGGGGDESLPVRLSYEHRSDGDDGDDESEDEDCDDHELEFETKHQPRVSALGKTKAHAKWSATTTASPDTVVLGSGKRKHTTGRRTNGNAGSSKRPKGTFCRFNGGCDKKIETNGLCKAHGGGQRCRHAGGCHKGIQSHGLCKTHGGGQRCRHPGGCDKAIHSYGLCRAHGGGMRCQHAGGCNKHIVKKRLCRQHGKAAGVWD